MPDLVVTLYGTHVGNLEEHREGFDFIASETGIERFGLQSTILSFAIPLDPTPRPRQRAVRRNFFDELLPEGRARTRLAGNARIPADYTVGMLARYGRDVAGALKIWDPNAPGEPRTPSLVAADESRVADLIAEVRTAPIGNDSVRRLSSLAGVQDKFVLVRTSTGWAEPLDGYPSTHIVKPVVPERPSLIFDEEYGARIARRLGLATFETQLETFAGRTALVVQRYDRDPAAPDGRLHQEDFNQALGFSGDAKYEENGHPGLATIARLLRDYVGGDSRQRLLQYATLSIAVGNLDMHAKNLSVLHRPDGSAALAPMYDVVPQLHLVEDHNFAFSINGKFSHSEITLEDLAAEGRSWGLRAPERIVEATVEAIRAAVDVEQPAPGAHFSLREDIVRFTENLSAGRGASAHHPPRFSGANRELRGNPGGWGGPMPG